MLRANFPSLYKGGSSMKYGSKSKMVKPKVKKIKVKKKGKKNGKY